MQFAFEMDRDTKTAFWQLVKNVLEKCRNSRFAAAVQGTPQKVDDSIVEGYDDGQFPETSSVP
jgi:hypothetical protein